MGFILYFILMAIIYLRVGALLDKKGIETFTSTWWDMVLYMSLLVGMTIFFWR